jgi:cell division protein FtsI (penicillin-binding protein 3)
MASRTHIRTPGDTSGNSIQQEMLRRRLPLVIVVMLVAVLVVLFRVISFQFPQDPRVVRELAALRDAGYGRTERIESARGVIYDRDGEPMAVNTRQYRVGISPNLVADPARAATQLAAILNRDELELLQVINSDLSYYLLGTVDPDTWQQINRLEMGLSIEVERIQRRYYPQGPLASQVIGFVAGDEENFRGYIGVEGYYEQELAGRVRTTEVSNIPFGLPEDPAAMGEGADLILTIDRDVQYFVESELAAAIASTGATGGTIIVMDPRTGDILGMASWPTFDPNAISEITNQQLLNNPAISSTWEPGSIFKVITVAAGIETGAITPNWTYYDNGILNVGGISVYNWDRAAHGLTDVTTLIANSLNVGASSVSLQMGYERFYAMMDAFNIGAPTRVDLPGEEGGILPVPGDEIWSESNLATNAYGQGLAVTPLQMLTAVNAIANDGRMMQPRIVCQVIDGDRVEVPRPVQLGHPISVETANAVTDMMVTAVQGLDEAAQLPGYTVAGKTGTAEIPGPGGYEQGVYNMSFVGFLPADNPQISVIVKLDRPTSGNWASQVAAPVFRRLAERLVILLEIPNDQIRLALNAEGGNTDLRGCSR